MFDDSYERAIKLAFKDELEELYKSRNLERTRILDETEAIMQDAGYVPGVEYEKLTSRSSNEYLTKIASETNILISELPGHGSFKYDYLPTPAKEQLNKIVDILLEKTDIRSAYDTYLTNVKKGLQLQGKTVTKINTEIDKAEKDLRKRIANKVLTELKGSLLDSKFPDNIKEDTLVYEGYNMYERLSGPQDQEEHYFIEWNDSYKNAMDLLYGEERDIEAAFDILEDQAISGNALAIFESGKLIDRELLQEIDKGEAIEFYDEAKNAFEKIYDTSDDEYKKQYAAYRVGKYFSMALGSLEEADYEKAKLWLERASNNKYAQYTLGKLYLADKIFVSDKLDSLENKIKARELFEKSVSSKKGNPFASYELGKMYASGIGTDIDNIKSQRHYKEALNQFLNMSKDSTDDNLFYRLGRMYTDGLGTEANVDVGEEYIKKAAELGNETAKLHLASLYVKKDDDILRDEGIKLLENLAGQDNLMAQYKLGAIYADRELPELYNLEKAIEYLEASAEQGNQFAQYKLGAIYADRELPELYNLEKAIEYLEASAEQGNQFAQYKLGSIYADQELPAYYNPEKAIKYLTASAEQGNQFAQCKLGIMYYYGKGITKDEELGKYWLHSSASQGNEIAQSILDGKGIDFSYCLLKGVLSSLENFNRQAKQNYNDLARTQSKQAAREKFLHKDRERD